MFSFFPPVYGTSPLPALTLDAKKERLGDYKNINKDQRHQRSCILERSSKEMYKEEA